MVVSPTIHFLKDRGWFHLQFYSVFCLIAIQLSCCQQFSLLTWSLPSQGCTSFLVFSLMPYTTNADAENKLIIQKWKKKHKTNKHKEQSPYKLNRATNKSLMKQQNYCSVLLHFWGLSSLINSDRNQPKSLGVSAKGLKLGNLLAVDVLWPSQSHSCCSECICRLAAFQPLRQISFCPLDMLLFTSPERKARVGL